MAPPLTIIVPAKHEEQTIGTVLAAIATCVHTPHRVVVVNDTDTTDQTHTKIKKSHGISIIHRINKHGTFGSALALALNVTKTPYVVFVMADLCDNAKDIDQMYEKLTQGYDVVCASRYAKGGKKIGGPIIQSFFSWFVCKSLRVITGIPTTDISNAFKMYKTRVLHKIPIAKTSGVEVSMEIVLQAFYLGARITEIPTTWVGRTKGQSKFKFFERLPRYWHIYFRALAHNASPQPGTRV